MCLAVLREHGLVTDLSKLEPFLRRRTRTGYCTPDMPTVTEQMNDVDDKLFCSVLRNQHHVLQYFLADNYSYLVYNLRPRKHDKTLISLRLQKLIIVTF